MNSEIITDELTQRILKVLEKEVPVKGESITFEVQDDGQCVMFYVPVDEIPHDKRQSSFERIGLVLDQMVPGRHGDYSWFATFTESGTRVDSCFGGNLDFPGSIF